MSVLYLFTNLKEKHPEKTSFSLSVLIRADCGCGYNVELHTYLAV